jgi:hypothetical protein
MPESNRDLSLTIEAMMLEHWRTTPTWQKLAYINELNTTLKNLAISDLHRRYPSETDAQLHYRLAIRWLGSDLANRVYSSLHTNADATY